MINIAKSIYTTCKKCILLYGCNYNSDEPRNYNSDERRNYTSDRSPNDNKISKNTYVVIKDEPVGMDDPYIGINKAPLEINITTESYNPIESDEWIRV